MRYRYIVCYDISADHRRQRVYEVMRGYGQHVQYSVFVCDLDRQGKAELVRDLREKMNENEDRVMLCEVGALGTARAEAFQFLGRSGPDFGSGPMIV